LGTVILGSALAVWALVPFDVLGNPKIVGLIAAPILVVATLFVWHVSEQGRNKDADWLRNLTISTPFVGAISFGIDLLVGSTNGSYTNFVQTASHAGGPFGIVITVLICPISTIVAAACWVRSTLLERFFPTPGALS